MFFLVQMQKMAGILLSFGILIVTIDTHMLLFYIDILVCLTLVLSYG